MEEIYNGYSNEKVLDVLGEYAIYLRKSRADIEAEAKGEGETLARHEHILLDLANKKGLKIGKIYREIVSGETIEARPEMQKLLADVKNNTNHEIQERDVTIEVLDKQGNVITRLNGVIDTVGAGEKVQLNMSVTGDVANAYDFRIK